MSRDVTCTGENLGGSEVSGGGNPDVYFVRIRYLVDELGGRDESVSQPRILDVILTGLPDEYRPV